ncbi:MAG: hypothetical protein DRJ37_05405, partial [Thermoprotei archaeon]
VKNSIKKGQNYVEIHHENKKYRISIKTKDAKMFSDYITAYVIKGLLNNIKIKDAVDMAIAEVRAKVRFKNKK